MIRRHKWKVIILGLLLIILSLGIIPRNTNIHLNNGCSASIRTAPFWRTFFPEASASIIYKPLSGQPGSIVLWQDVFDGPVAIIAAKDTNVLLCLYDYDVEFELFRIDTGKVFQPLPRDSVINRILFTSTWEIQAGSYSDWQEMLNYLRTAPASEFLSQSASVGTRLKRTPEDILKLLEYQHIK